jgi:orotate phosphoribosyltransferase
MKPRPDAIGGLTIGAAPLSITVSQMALERGWNLPVFVVRDEPKGHGTKKKIEGDFKPGWKVVIVDDVITTGNSVLKAITAAKDSGAEIAKVIILVDREESRLDNLKDYDTDTIFTYKELQG